MLMSPCSAYTAWAAGLCLFAHAAADGLNYINFPAAGDVVPAGEPCIINWSPGTPGPVFIALLDESGEGTGTLINSTANTGQWTWIPLPVVATYSNHDNYFLQICDLNTGDCTYTFNGRFTVSEAVSSTTTTLTSGPPSPTSLSLATASPTSSTTGTPSIDTTTGLSSASSSSFSSSSSPKPNNTPSSSSRDSAATAPSSSPSSPSSSSSTSSSDASSSGGLSTTATIAIGVVVSIVGTAAILIGGFFLYHRRKRSQQKRCQRPASNQYGHFGKAELTGHPVMSQKEKSKYGHGHWTRPAELSGVAEGPPTYHELGTSRRNGPGAP